MMKDDEPKYFLGVDCGTSSVRVTLVDPQGKFHGIAVNKIQTWNPEPNFYEQSSNDIWSSICKCVHQILKDSKIESHQVKGIGFDATCSLVALDLNNQPVTISKSGNDEQNVILWMDHRAIQQANFINQTKHEVLAYVGGTISPEMECPKMLWLKQNLPSSWKRISKFFDLADFLSYKATGIETRSLCTVVCKWTFQGHLYSEGRNGWSESFFKQIGFEDFVEDNFQKIGGANIEYMGKSIGNGLTSQAARGLGLNEGTPVAVGMIDAHAGGLGLLGASLHGEKITAELLEKRIALISGTSTCHMAVSTKPLYIPGIWGPYYSAMIPKFWLTEGGQSATGALIDHIIFSHSANVELIQEASKKNISIYEFLNEKLDSLAKEKNLPFLALLTKDVHVFPDFHGNRSPRADPTLKGIISGLNLDKTINELAIIYLATIQAIAYETFHIISEMNLKGYNIDSIFLTGGSLKNRIYVQEHADITQCIVIHPQESEAVLLGASILGAVASNTYSSILEAMSHMNKIKEITQPNPITKQYHQKKYQVFLKLYEDFISYRKIMED